jgi:DNA-binding transcriptional MerR regulator
VSEDIFFWSQAERGPRSPAAQPAAAAPEATSGRQDRTPPEAIGRLTLREASEQYGVAVSTLRSWCRRGAVAGSLVDPGPRWMVDPASIEHHLTSRGGATARRTGSGPAPGGGMLVPRDAWDRLMGQLTNLHDTGQQLAEARERAARAETEAAFLRERLSELRSERDDWRERADRTEPPAAGARAGLLRRLLGSRE